MNRRVLFFSALLAGLVACGNDGKGGEAIQGRVEASIGPGGGTLGSTDGEPVVTFPAGAFSEETLVSVERIENDAPHGVGLAWRLQPSGVVFAVPVQLSFALADGHSGGLAPAFREGTGPWRGMLLHEIEEGRLELATTHFSDWALFEAMRLRVSASRIRTGGTVTLQVESCIGETDPETLLTALVPTCEAIEPSAPEAADFSDWAVNGVLGGDPLAGWVVSEGSRATYSAPDVEPAENPVAISVGYTLPPKASGLLVANVEVEPSDCPLGICRLDCTTRAVTETAGGVGIVETAEFTLEYERTVGGTAQYFPSGGKITTSQTLEGCTVSITPDTAPIDRDSGNLSLTLVDERPNYAGGGEVEFEATTVTTCPPAEPISDTGPTSAFWHIGYGELGEPPYAVEGEETVGITTYTWNCEIEG